MWNFCDVILSCHKTWREATVIVPCVFLSKTTPQFHNHYGSDLSWYWRERVSEAWLEEVLLRSEGGHPTLFPKNIGKGCYYSSVNQCQILNTTFSGRSSSGFIVMLKCSPMLLFKKKKSYIETRSFGSKFISIIQCLEYLSGLRCKLRMTFILIDNTCLVYE